MSATKEGDGVIGKRKAMVALLQCSILLLIFHPDGGQSQSADSSSVDHSKWVYTAGESQWSSPIEEY